jgi:ketosteroid isomerase-like protein
LKVSGPKFVIKTWVEALNNADVDKLASLYTKDAINHQVNQDPVEERDAIREMFRNEFDSTNMTCIIENLFEDGEWAVLE